MQTGINLKRKNTPEESFSQDPSESFKKRRTTRKPVKTRILDKKTYSDPSPEDFQSLKDFLKNRIGDKPSADNTIRRNFHDNISGILEKKRKDLNIIRGNLTDISEEKEELFIKCMRGAVHLERLHAQMVGFSTYTDILDNLKNLTSLNLSLNALGDIPKQIFGLSKLRELNIKKTNIKIIQDEINNLTALKSLDISENPIKTIKNIKELKSLKRLYLTGTNIKFENIPEYIRELQDIHIDIKPFSTMPPPKAASQEQAGTSQFHTKKTTPLPSFVSPHYGSFVPPRPVPQSQIRTSQAHANVPTTSQPQRTKEQEAHEILGISKENPTLAEINSAYNSKSHILNIQPNKTSEDKKNFQNAYNFLRVKKSYDILELECTATLDDVKKRYKAKALETHPDKEGGDNEKFTELKDAYDNLGKYYAVKIQACETLKISENATAEQIKEAYNREKASIEKTLKRLEGSYKFLTQYSTL